MQSRDVIRLTNKTARELRRSAARMRRVYVAVAVVVTLALCVAAVLLGLRTLYAVPVTVLVIVLLDAAILTAGQSRYSALSGQAICTEAAARQIRGETDERSRRRQAALDLAAIKADVAQETAQEASAQEEPDPDLLPERPQKKPRIVRETQENAQGDTRRVRPAEKASAAPQEAPGAHRRRRQAAFQVIESERAR
ncbi:MAG: hypothetical protein PUH70_04890 [Clostridiales bacterium]|nr:hypothetical protein [Clostridiales bacterium]MDY5515229.1 hypothetical protein [Candidatus Ventricola sp.]